MDNAKPTPQAEKEKKKKKSKKDRSSPTPKPEHDLLGISDPLVNGLAPEKTTTKKKKDKKEKHRKASGEKKEKRKKERRREYEEAEGISTSAFEALNGDASLETAVPERSLASDPYLSLVRTSFRCIMNINLLNH